MRLLIRATCIALACWTSISFAASAQEPTLVLAQNLEKLRGSGKVLGALWTMRSDSCTLQVVFPLRTQARPAAPRLPEVQVWLLKADGTHIPWTRAKFPEVPKGGLLRISALEVSYSFPLSASTEAVAAVVRIGDDFYIEPLTPLGNRKEASGGTSRTVRTAR